MYCWRFCFVPCVCNTRIDRLQCSFFGENQHLICWLHGNTLRMKKSVKKQPALLEWGGIYTCFYMKTSLEAHNSLQLPTTVWKQSFKSLVFIFTCLTFNNLFLFKTFQCLFVSLEIFMIIHNSCKKSHKIKSYEET